MITLFKHLTLYEQTQPEKSSKEGGIHMGSAFFSWIGLGWSTFMNMWSFLALFFA